MKKIEKNSSFDYDNEPVPVEVAQVYEQKQAQYSNYKMRNAELSKLKKLSSIVTSMQNEAAKYDTTVSNILLTIDTNYNELMSIAELNEQMKQLKSKLNYELSKLSISY